MKLKNAASWGRLKEFDRNALERIGREGIGVDLVYLPMYPMLMIDYAKIHDDVEGPLLLAEGRKDLYPHDWFFKAHFVNDAVMPGCLVVEGIWQLLSFMSTWCFTRNFNQKSLSLNCINRARVLSSKDIRFKDQTLPGNKFITYSVNLDRIVTKNVVKNGQNYNIHLVTGNGNAKDFSGKICCSVSDMIIRFGPLFDEDYNPPK